MKVRIRPDLCCGVQLCVKAAPGLFRLDSMGYNDSDGRDVPEGREEEARKAVEVCPEGAIYLEDD